MLIELAIYEAVTTAGGLLGLKIWADRKYLKGINVPKSTPFDRVLKKHVGNTTKTEEFLSVNTVKFIQNISKYQSFRYLLILAGRKARENATNRNPIHIGL